MALAIRALHRADKSDLLNEEWILIENTGPGAQSAQGCTISVARGKGQRPSQIGTPLVPGFVLQVGEKVRIVTGSPSKKSQGTPPAEEDGVKNYHLFHREPVLTRPGQIIVISLKQLELARVAFAPDKDGGIAPA